MLHGFLIYTLTVGITLGSTTPSSPLSVLGAGRLGTSTIPLGGQMPPMHDAANKGHGVWSPRIGQTVASWSARELPDWKIHGKVTAPRVLLAKLAANHDIEAVNRYLQEAKPRAGTGSTWFLHDGDYDFSLVTLSTILCLFGNDPERLYPETLEHLLTVLLNEEGGTPLVTVPNTWGLILDTENHHLMTEGSRYLKNQWLATHGNDEQRADPQYDNRANGLGAWLEAYLDEMINEGVYEFNSKPYVGYTLQALLNLDAFPDSPEIRGKARYLLDIMNLQYALGSLDLRRNPPFRRQYAKLDETRFSADPHTAYMDAWLRLSCAGYDGAAEEHRYSGHALLAKLLPYRLPEDLCRWTLEKTEPYFVRFGRGPAACPEIYSGGPGYLLSAGGANRGIRSHIVPRPITLLLEDGAEDTRECIQLQGRRHWMTWNHTGVYRHFACANGPVRIPGRMITVAEHAGWRIIEAPSREGLLVAVYEGSRAGLIALFPESSLSAEELLDAIRDANPDAEALNTQFTWPGGDTLTYDVNAPKGVWVMKSVNGAPLDRDYDAWPQFSGDIRPISFAR